MIIITRMINILLNDTKFDASWAYASLSPYLKKDSKVLVLPLIHSEGWSSDEEEWEHQYQKGGKKYNEIISSFRNYLIPEKNITFFQPYKDSKETFQTLLKQSDVVYLYGDDAEHMMMCMQDLELKDLFLRYDGIIMSNHAGSNLIMHHYDSKYQWEEEELEGLGLLQGFALMPDYIEDAAHLARLIRNIEQRGKAVLVFGKDGGALIQNGHYELLGNAFTVSYDDLDSIYHAYEDAKSRLDYYGDNGLW